MPLDQEQKNRPIIFLIEDDVFMIELLAQVLSRAGYETLSFRLGKEAIEKFKETKPDLILLDILLPDANGLDVLREIRRMPEGAEAKVLVLSNIAEIVDKEQAKRLGALDYLIKANHSLPEILEKVNSLLMLPHASAALRQQG